MIVPDGLFEIWQANSHGRYNHPEDRRMYTVHLSAKARRLLDYNPQVSVAEGVRRFWEWYREHDVQSN